MAMIPFVNYYIFGLGTNPNPTPPQPTTLTKDPCPKCRCTQYLYVDERLVCSSCRLPRNIAAATVKRFAQRDQNGSLLCQACNEPYPYADPNADGTFVCYGCRTQPSTIE